MEQQPDIAWEEIEQPAGEPLVPSVDGDAVDVLRRRTYLSYENLLRARLAESDRTRPERWPRDYSSHAAYQVSVEPLRAELKAMLGFWIEPAARGPVRCDTAETIYEDGTFTAQRFAFEVFPGLESYAVTLLPKGRAHAAGLLIQHGYSGTPELACGLTPSANCPDYGYRSMGIRAVRRGFPVVAVHHPTAYGSSEDTVRNLPAFPTYPWTYGKNRLHRLAVMAGGTLFGLDMMTSSRGIDLLCLLPGVAPERIGMYGLSQGGQSAVYLPALDPRVQASVASAWFNDRTRKMLGPHRALPYLDSLEEDKFFSQIISHFSDSDVVSLIAPRAFAVEAGLHDGSVDFEGAHAEFAKVQAHYEQLGIPERCRFIPHAEGHVPATRAAFDFLEAQLLAE